MHDHPHSTLVSEEASRSAPRWWRSAMWWAAGLATVAVLGAITLAVVVIPILEGLDCYRDFTHCRPRLVVDLPGGVDIIDERQSQAGTAGDARARIPGEWIADTRLEWTEIVGFYAERGLITERRHAPHPPQIAVHKEDVRVEITSVDRCSMSHRTQSCSEDNRISISQYRPFDPPPGSSSDSP